MSRVKHPMYDVTTKPKCYDLTNIFVRALVLEGLILVLTTERHLLLAGSLEGLGRVTINRAITIRSIRKHAWEMSGQA